MGSRYSVHTNTERGEAEPLHPRPDLRAPRPEGLAAGLESCAQDQVLHANWLLPRPSSCF